MVSNDSRAVFLSPDERYDVWVVKRAERPELLERPKAFEPTELDSLSTTDPPLLSDTCVASSYERGERSSITLNEESLNLESAKISLESDEDANDHDSIDQLPLTDGCDLVNWRNGGFLELPNDSQTLAVMDVGYGCSLLRRESQFPLPPTTAFSQWNRLRQKLLKPPPSHVSPSVLTCNDVVESLDGSRPWFERENVPAVLLDCTKGWAAMESCSLTRLVERFGHLDWRFSDTHGETMNLTTYYKYIQWEGRLDDAPLAVYDSQFALDVRACILDEYSVPQFFASDLLDLLPDDQRPPYRWILIGPARSGTGLHIDPAGTHAWVTLVEGCKRWVLFPYGTDPALIHMQDPAIPSSIWFRDHYDQVVSQNLGAVEVLQRPGETVYVPAGWPHLVLNLETSVAITHNYASAEPSMQRLWEALSHAEPEMARIFYSRLENHRPDLVESILYCD